MVFIINFNLKKWVRIYFMCPQLQKRLIPCMKSVIWNLKGKFALKRVFNRQQPTLGTNKNGCISRYPSEIRGSWNTYAGIFAYKYYLAHGRNYLNVHLPGKCWYCHLLFLSGEFRTSSQWISLACKKLFFCAEGEREQTMIWPWTNPIANKAQHLQLCTWKTIDNNLYLLFQPTNHTAAKGQLNKQKSVTVPPSCLWIQFSPSQPRL